MGRGRREGEGGGKRGGDPLGELTALEEASLEALKRRYPAEWERTGNALVAAVEKDRAAGGAAFLARARAAAAPWRARVGRSGGNPTVVKSALPHLVRERMARLALEATVEGAVARTAGAGQGGVLRFGRVSGALVNALLFERGLERKPVSMGWFRALWPLVRDKNVLMPLVESRGIYCFYSRPLVRALAELVGEGPALEIAAGDGTLSRFLEEAGAPILATDDHSWQHAVTYSEKVERLDARAALQRHRPRVVLCSWPPPDNSFEREVFRTASVERYVVIASRHRFAAGAFRDYEAQTAFTMRQDEALSRLVLPPELDPVVLVFERRA